MWAARLIDLLVSFVVGITAAAVVIHLLPKNHQAALDEALKQEVTRDSDANQENVKNDTSIQTARRDEHEDDINGRGFGEAVFCEPELSSDIADKLHRKPHLRKFFGVSEEKLEKFIKTEESSGNKSAAVDPERYADDLDGDLITLLSWFLFAGMGILVMYVVNVASDGELGRVIAGIFPVETEALKIKGLLEHWVPSAVNKMK